MPLTQPIPTGRGQGQLWELEHHKGQGTVSVVPLVLGTRQCTMQAQGAGGKLRGQNRLPKGRRETEEHIFCYLSQ